MADNFTTTVSITVRMSQIAKVQQMREWLTPAGHEKLNNSEIFRLAIDELYERQLALHPEALNEQPTA